MSATGAHFWSRLQSGAVAIGAGVAIAALCVAAAPAADATGSISGRVTNLAGEPLTNVGVSVSTDLPGAGGYVVTGTDGSYTVSGLASGSYRVQFYDSTTRGYVAEYFDDAHNWSEADPVQVATGAERTGIDAVLTLGGSVSGRVTNAAGEPLAEITVFGEPAAPAFGFGAGMVTGADGRYTLRALAAGSYRIRFADPRGGYALEYYDDAVSWNEAALVSVTAGEEVAGIDATLERGGTVSGRVTNESGAPVEGISVSANSASSAFAMAVTDADGRYTVAGLGPGSFRVWFSDARGRGYVAEYYDDASYSAATLIDVGFGTQIVGIDAVLALGASLSGRVTNEAGEPLADVSVGATPLSPGDASIGATTGSDGTYRISGLRAGSYRLSFSDMRGRGYVREYYDDALSASAAHIFTLSAGVEVTGIDAVLSLGGSISGRVTDAAGNPLLQVSVLVLEPSGGWIAGAATVADGTYRVTGVLEGAHRVQFIDYHYRGYVPEFYDDAPTLAAATPVVVVGSAETSGIDAELVLGGSISGRVTNEAGQPLEGVSVNVTVASGASVYGLTGLDGRYTIAGVGTGSHRVWFSDVRGRGYAGEYYDDAASWSAARVLTVAAGTDLTGIDAVLTLGGSVSGRVVNAAGDPLVGIRVSIYDASGSRSVQTAADGTYSFPGLLPGSYRIGFADETDAYADEYHEDAGSLDTATTVAVTAGGTVRVDASLARAGTISGRVTNTAGEPLAGITVSAMPFTGSGTTATTAANGTYTLRGLRSSTYRVAFIDGGPRSYVSEYFDDERRWESAATLSVAAGSDLLGIDAELELGGSISGRVTNAGGMPLEGVFVLANPSVPALGGYARTAADGNYTVYGLGAGTYRVHFVDFSETYVEEYFDNHASSMAATLVSLDDRAFVTGIDASLGQTGTMSEQSIAFPPLAGKTFGDPDFAAGASASSGLSVAYAASGSCTVADGVVHLTGAGSCSLTASQRGDDVYFAAPDVIRMFAVEKASQTIDFAPLEGRTWGDPDFDVAASASSGLQVVFSATGSCTVAGRTIRLSDVGGCSVTASQPGDADYEPAAEVTQTFVVAWPFTGFLAPLRGDDIIEVKAGSTVPLKFSLGGAWGLDVLAPGSPRSLQVACPTAAPEDAVLPADASGSSRLSFEDGVYHYGWKTEVGWAGTCRELVVELRDTTVHAATFSLR